MGMFQWIYYKYTLTPNTPFITSSEDLSSLNAYCIKQYISEWSTNTLEKLCVPVLPRPGRILRNATIARVPDLSKNAGIPA